jgi:hypothetical protein
MGAEGAVPRLAQQQHGQFHVDRIVFDDEHCGQPDFLLD